MNKTKRFQPESNPVAPRFSGVLLYIVALPLLPAAIRALASGSAAKAVGFALGFAAAMIAATMIRRGLMIEREAKRRKIVRRASTVPYKTTGAIVIGIGMFLVAMANGYPIIVQILFAAAASLGAWLYYGSDPSRKAGDIATVGITSEELIELLDGLRVVLKRLNTREAEYATLNFARNYKKSPQGRVIFLLPLRKIRLMRAKPASF